MSNLGEQAMEILDELHKERLDYDSEYIPLAEAANLLTAYEQTGLEPESIERMQDALGRGLTLRTDARERLEIIKGLSTDRLRRMVAEDRAKNGIFRLIFKDEQSDFSRDQWAWMMGRFTKEE